MVILTPRRKKKQPRRRRQKPADLHAGTIAPSQRAHRSDSIRAKSVHDLRDTL